VEISVSEAKGKRPITVFHITGEISSYSHQALEDQARQAHAEGMKDLLLDMKDVTFVSSGGIRALNAILKLLRTDAPEESDEAMSKGIRDGSFHSPHLKLVHVSRQIKDIFKLAGVDMLLDIHDDFQKAVDAF
jgi:anti-anti-sigma regulatory factor